MPSPTPILLALALALALAPTPATAQQVVTSQGIRTLPSTDAMSTEDQYRQAVRTAEGIVAELLQDVAAVDGARATVGEDTKVLTERIKKATADYDRAKAAYDLVNEKYRADLAAFQQRQSALEADIQQQRNEAAALQALPSAQRDINAVTRLNDWAARIGKERDAIEAERNRLLADHASVEAERGRLAQQRIDAEAKLKGSRDDVLGQFGSTEERRRKVYSELRTAVNYLARVREALTRVSKTQVARSEIYEQANAKLRVWESRTR